MCLPLLLWRRFVLFWWTLGSLTELSHRGGGGQSLLLFFFPDGHSWAQKQTWTRRAVGQHLHACPRLKWSNWRHLSEAILSFSFFHCWKKGKGSAKKKNNHLEIKLCVSECAIYAQGAPWNFKMLDRLAFVVVHVLDLISFVAVSSSELTVTMCRG